MNDGAVSKAGRQASLSFEAAFFKKNTTGGVKHGRRYS
ncbi:hypothetical protein EfmE980_0421 [Enterococcus faecium E980]|nr:hypothetical protein EfmE980_0421 [Enterococcus faecium E980]MBL4989009.1 hypothetical protein [Enterococcus lactis]MBL4991036.1 hypothetical protein [Enterococcus lactis]MBL5003438.1 hypothetical protein [Enterococcus lactis]